MTYLGNPYHPWWLDNLAANVTGQGAFMEGVAEGADAVRSIVTYARTVYDNQKFSFVGDYGSNGYIEEYTADIQGHSTSVVVTVARNAGGMAQRIVVNHRPRSSVLLIARLCSENFAGTPLADLFGASGS
ncbi:MAG TPA: hypothetical protein VMG38_00675 [Trebonia sp.]|nr:hypothetical protein [Trebonia sp.]